MLGRLVDEHQRTRPTGAVWGNLRSRLDSLDGLFINLECCLSTRGERWTETYRPFHFRADPGWAVPALELVGVDYASLANNHLMDFGTTALLDTVDHLDEAGIAHAGAGNDRSTARGPTIVSLPSLDVAVISFTDNTPEYAAGADDPGVAHLEMDPDSDVDRRIVREAIGRARDLQPQPDLLIASLHWGPNMVTEPADHYRHFGHFLIEEGVDLIHGHSAHVFQGIELYDGQPILYDCGDFVDDYAVDETLRNDRSFLFTVTVDPDTAELLALRLFPVEIYDFSVHEATDETAEWCRSRMRERSTPFGTEFERDGAELVLSLM